MAYDAELYREIEAEYEDIRRQNEVDLAERRERVFKNVPEAFDVDNEIKMLGLKLYKIALSGGNVQQQVKNLRTQQKQPLCWLKTDMPLTSFLNGFCALNAAIPGLWEQSFATVINASWC